MKLNDQEIRVLRMTAQGPRTLHSFTHSSVASALAPCAPNILVIYLERMIEEKLIVYHDGWYHITAEGLARLADLSIPDVAPSRYYGNASMPSGSWVPKRWECPRAGGEQHPPVSEPRPRHVNDYAEFLRQKIKLASSDGFDVAPEHKTVTALGRRGGGSELSAAYFADQVHYLRAMEREVSMPTLFDLDEAEEAVAA